MMVCSSHALSWRQYAGNDSIYTFTFEYEQRPECPVCGGESITAMVGRDWTLEQFVEWLSTHQALYVSLLLPLWQRRDGLISSQIKKPSISYATGQPLFYQAPPQMHELTKGNLDKLVVDLIGDGDEVVVTDPALPFTLNVVIKYQ